MMRKFSCFIFGFILWLYSCKEEDRPPLNADYWGEASALKNGEDWKPFILGVTDHNKPGRFLLGMDIYDSEGFQRERLSLSKVPEAAGKYPLYWTDFRENDTTEAFYSTILDDGDVLGDVYYGENQSNSFVKITEYDSETREIKGTFEITMVLSRDNGYGPEPPDTLRFTNGAFHTRVMDNWLNE